MSQSTKERQAAHRARKGIVKTISINLTAEEHAKLEACFELQGHAENWTQFAKASLLTGAAFVANAGTPRGRKIKTGGTP